MKNSKILLVAAAGLFLVASTPRLLADDSPKTITITGDMVCGKCTLHETKTCQNVVQVTKDGKTVQYFLVRNDISNAAHEAVCGGSSEKVTVTGTVTEKDGKEIMTPSKIEPVKS
jgi:hypothetical protein